MKTCSAARPPSVMQMRSSSCSVVMSRFSLGRYCANPSVDAPRGTMLTLSSGSQCSRNQPTTWRVEAGVDNWGRGWDV